TLACIMMCNLSIWLLLNIETCMPLPVCHAGTRDTCVESWLYADLTAKIAIAPSIFRFRLAPYIIQPSFSPILSFAVFEFLDPCCSSKHSDCFILRDYSLQKQA